MNPETAAMATGSPKAGLARNSLYSFKALGRALTELGEAQAGVVDQAGSALGNTIDFMHVEDEAVGVVGHALHASDDVLHPVHRQRLVKPFDQAARLDRQSGCGSSRKIHAHAVQANNEQRQGQYG